MSSRRSMRLRLRRRPDPVLTEDELDFIDDLLGKVVDDADWHISKGGASESTHRRRLLAISAHEKIAQVLRA